MLARILVALPTGVAITGALLYTMDLLIATGQNQSDIQVARIVEFVRIERTETVEAKVTRPDKPEAPVPQPDLDLSDAGGAFDDTITVALVRPSLEFGVDIARSSMSATDGEYLPIVKVAPVYPTRALQRRLEGYVIVEFVVTANGAVRDVSVIESSDAVFERAAIDAAMKFRYKPRVVDGSPIEVAGVQNRITFRLSA